MASLTLSVDQLSPLDSQNHFISDQGKLKGPDEEREIVEYDGVCAICLDHIELQETALIKDCDHAYCVRCILQWVTYHDNPKCPQCKHPFESLSVHRALDGSLCDYLLEESVCLLVRAAWFTPSTVKTRDDFYDDPYDIFYYQYQYQYEYEELEDVEDLDEDYFNSSSSLNIGNRRWGDNGYIRAGRKEARPLHSPYSNDVGAGSSRQRKQKEAERETDGSSWHEPKKDSIGRRAKRALRRETADRAKHQQQLVRMCSQ